MQLLNEYDENILNDAKIILENKRNEIINRYAYNWAYDDENKMPFTSLTILIFFIIDALIAYYGSINIGIFLSFFIIPICWLGYYLEYRPIKIKERIELDEERFYMEEFLFEKFIN